MSCEWTHFEEPVAIVEREVGAEFGQPHCFPL
jgi:hypothetical protein